MTYKQYIENPLGKHNAVFSQRDMYKSFYSAKFDNIILREAGKIDYTLLYDKDNDAYYCHIKIPSEVVPKFYYDTVIKFTTDDNALRPLNSLKDYNVSFFSNDPSFVYTYMYVFKEHDMLITDLVSKCPKLALTKKPEEKNPQEIVGYVKSLYFAYLYMNNKSLFNKYDYKTNGLQYSKNILLENVMDAMEKIEQRQQKGIEVKEKEASKDNVIDRFRTGASTVNNALNKVKSHAVNIKDKLNNVVNKVKTVKILKKKK